MKFHLSFFLTRNKFILLVVFSLMNYSCYSFYGISKEELKQKDSTSVIKIEMQNKTEIKAEAKNIIIMDSLITILQGTEKKVLYSPDIKKISEQKPDPINTLFTTAWIIGIASLVIVIMIFSNFQLH